MVYKKLFGFDFSVTVNDLNINEFFSRHEFILEDSPNEISVEFKKISPAIGDIEIHVYEKGFYAAKKILHNNFIYKTEIKNSNILVLDFYFKNPFFIDRLEYIGDVQIVSEAK
jgi:hypothetical protein